MAELAFHRILLKLSGEALMGSGSFGIDPEVIGRTASEVKELVLSGVQVALVIGGGNIFRGKGLAENGIDRVSADQMGMLATVMNSLAMQDALARIDVDSIVMSALRIDSVCEPYVRREAIHHLESGRVAIFAAGTGNPFFTTDTAAALRAVEINANLLVKATKVDGIYSADPVRHPDATFYPRLSYDRALRENLQVMDTTAIVLCRDHRMPLRVMNVNRPGALLALVHGEPVGSLVESGE